MASTDCNITYDAICPTQAEKLSHVLEESASYQERDTTLMGVTCNPAELDLSCVSVPSEDLSTVKSNSSFAETDDLVASSAAHSSHTGADSFHDGLDQSFVDEEAIEEISAPVSRSGRCLRRCRRDSETTVQCPICRISMRLADISSHVQLEIEKLSRISSKSKKLPAGDDTSPGHKAYFRVKRNRLARQHARGRLDDSNGDYTTCPICNQPIDGTPEELNEHVEYCLNRVQRTDEDQNVNVDDSDDEFEEYEWAGQKRVRASSMLPRDLTSASVSRSSASQCDDVTDLNIEDDDRLVYGEAQYSEADLLLCSSDNPSEEKSRNLLRNALLEGETSIVRCTGGEKAQNSAESATEQDGDSPMPSSTELLQSNSSASSSFVDNRQASPVNGQILSLKAKIADFERRLSETARCLVCMEPHNNPLTSIQCWHVYCEECWLRTLGAKKLCPQCNTITTPSDLRRIYL